MTDNKIRLEAGLGFSGRLDTVRRFYEIRPRRLVVALSLLIVTVAVVATAGLVLVGALGVVVGAILGLALGLVASSPSPGGASQCGSTGRPRSSPGQRNLPSLKAISCPRAPEGSRGPTRECEHLAPGT
jgi:hypothetical protein